MTTTLGVVAAGGVGALTRYLVDGAVQSRIGGIFPWGTFVINVTGSLVLGAIVGLALHQGLPDSTRVILGTGFCGGYTTFSTLSYESMRLVEDGARLEALLNMAASTAVGLLAAGIGLAATAAA